VIFISTLIAVSNARDLRPYNGTKKTFTAEFDKHELNIVGNSNKPGEPSQMSFSFSVKEGFPRLRVRFFKHSGNGKEAEKISKVFNVNLEALLEVNGIPSSANLTAARAARSLYFRRLSSADKAKWSPLALTKTKVDNATLYKATTHLNLVNHPIFKNLNISMIVEISDSFVKYNGQALDPLGLKYSLHISDFPYAKPDTHLTLIKSIWAQERNAKFNNKTKTSSSSTANGQLLVNDQFGLIDWESTIKADGVDLPVEVSELFRNSEDVEDDDKEPDKLLPVLLGFNFPRAKTLFWDPYVGCSADSNAAADADVINNKGDTNMANVDGSISQGSKNQGVASEVSINFLLFLILSVLSMIYA